MCCPAATQLIKPVACLPVGELQLQLKDKPILTQTQAHTQSQHCGFD
jgi:hypothetical protein